MGEPVKVPNSMYIAYIYEQCEILFILGTFLWHLNATFNCYTPALLLSGGIAVSISVYINRLLTRYFKRLQSHQNIKIENALLFQVVYVEATCTKTICLFVASWAYYTFPRNQLAVGTDECPSEKFFNPKWVLIFILWTKSIQIIWYFFIRAFTKRLD